MSVTVTFQGHRSHLGISCDLSAAILISRSHLGINWYVVMTSQIGWFYIRTNETSQGRHKLVHLIHALVVTS